ncbi:MAG: MotA/TolQ/ExbB proton channel family protein [Xanthomonadales bacterium]|nr:MotA/TolQ/ExbB proton channel family protein [Xanthomonadales bacterium]
MLEFVIAGGWLMAPILLCSAIALGIVLERGWTLRESNVIPPELGEQVRSWAVSRKLDDEHIQALARNSPLGRVLAAALRNRSRSREIIKEAVEDTGRHVIHELERYLNALGTIAGITPLLGLLGTVIGMIKVFSAIMTYGVGDANALAGGISQALITTAAGLSVAIPAFFFYRYFQGRVERLVVEMEQQAIALIDTIDLGVKAGVRPLRSSA